MKYLLSVEVRVQEVPEEESIPTPRPGDDPMNAMSAMLGPAVKLMTGRPPLPFMGGTAGFDFRKTAMVTAPDFTALAGIVGKFDNLVHDIEVDAMTRQEL